MNTLITPGSGNISFSSFIAAGSNYLPPLSASARIAYTKDGGLTIVSTASSSERFNVEGNFGNLLTVNDSPTGRLFVINDVSGFPLFFISDNGSLSSASVVFASGGTSDDWNSVYTTTNNNSSNWDSTYNTVQANSASWEESAEILATVIPYLSTNYVTLSTVGTRSLSAEYAFLSAAIIQDYLSAGQIYAYEILKIVGPISGSNTRTSFNLGSATGNLSFAINQSKAFGQRSFAAGNNAVAGGSNSIAEGSSTKAFGTTSHAEGTTTLANNTNSHAEGSGTTASGQQSHAEGTNSTASGTASHAEGQATQATGDRSHAEGTSSVAQGTNSHAEGSGTTASGLQSHTEGTSTIASNSNSHAEGQLSQATGVNSHAEGRSTIASGTQSHAEGLRSEARGGNSHAEGRDAFSIGDGSHAEGNNTKAIGLNAHVEGSDNLAIGNYSHAAGWYAAAVQDNTWVWNSDPNASTALYQVSSTRTGQYLVSAAGGLYLAGKVGIGTDSIDNALTVVGLISTDLHGNSQQWYNSYTNLVTNSANYLSGASINFVNANFVHISGDTMTGNLSAPAISATNIYVDGKYLITSRGGTNLFMGNSGINAFNTSGTGNIAIGLSAGHTITSGSDNVFIGNCTGRTLGGSESGNVFIGSKAGEAAVGNNSVFLGNRADSISLLGTACSLALGAGATVRETGQMVLSAGNLTLCSKGNHSIILGQNAGNNNFTGTNNIFVGLSAGAATIGGYNNVFIGVNAGKDNVGSIFAGDNVFIGTCAGNGLASDSVAIGACALRNSVNGSNMIAIGRLAGSQVRSGGGSVVINSLGGGQTATSILIGSSPLSNSFIGQTIAFGYSTLRSAAYSFYNLTIGGYAGAGMTTGIQNIILGTRAVGKFFGAASSGSNNIWFGNRAGYNLTTGSYNVGLGRYSGCSNTTGGNNVFIGNNANTTVETASGLLILGAGATAIETGQMVLSASNLTIQSLGIPNFLTAVGVDGIVRHLGRETNIAIGGYAGNRSLATASGINHSNILLGLSAGNRLFTEGSGIAASNVFIGRHAGRVMTCGAYNILIGGYSGSNLIRSGNGGVPQGNIFLGTAGASLRCGYSNILIGNYTFQNTKYGANNIVLGCRAGLNTDLPAAGAGSGGFNVFVGPAAGWNNTAGIRNTAIGGYAGAGLGRAVRSVALGYRAQGQPFTTGSGRENVSIGSYVGYGITTGSYNVLAGKRTGQTITAGGNNVIVGSCADTTVATASGLLILGASALARETGQMVLSASNMTICSKGTADDLNILIGSNVGNNNLTGKHNIVLGLSAGAAFTTSSSNILLGRWAGRKLSTGTGNIGIGYNVLAQNATGTGNIAIGQFAGASVCSNDNIFIGRFAGLQLTSGQENTFIGYRAGRNTNTTNLNVMIGASTGYHNTLGSGNLFLGGAAGFCSTTGSQNVFIGTNAGGGGYNIYLEQYNNTGCNNVFIGYNAGYLNGVGKYNVFTGHTAGKNNTSGCLNVFTGFGAGTYNYHGTNNVFIGGFAGQCSRSTKENTFIGYVAGTFLQGVRNIAIGKCSGARTYPTPPLSATESIFIGSGAGTRTNNLSTVIVLGTEATATQSNQIMIGTASSPLTGGRLSGGSTLHGNLNITIPYKIVEPQTASNVGFRFFTSEPGGSYLVDTRTNVVSTFLPTTPRVGQAITYYDPYYTWSSNNFILGYTDQPIEGYLESLSADIPGYTFTAIYVGGTYGWRIR